MRTEFDDDMLRRLADEPEFRPRHLGPDLIAAYRRKIHILRSAKDERDLRALRSLRLEQLSSDRAGTCSMRLNDQFGLIVTFQTDDDRRVVIVLDLVDYH